MQYILFLQKGEFKMQECVAYNENAIASAMTLLETLDEEDVHFTKDDYLQMIDDLKHNQECD